MEATSIQTGTRREPGKVGIAGRSSSRRRLLCGCTWAAIGAALAASGCQNSSGVFAKKSGGINRLSPRSVPYLTGVPVPSGFTMSERLTDAYESGGTRFARQEYSGYADTYAIREFYREQMPVMGWKEISSHDIKGRLSLRFETNSEECNVTIEPTMWFNYASIQVVVKPFNRSASEPPARRPMP